MFETCPSSIILIKGGFETRPYRDLYQATNVFSHSVLVPGLEAGNQSFDLNHTIS